MTPGDDVRFSIEPMLRRAARIDGFEWAGICTAHRAVNLALAAGALPEALRVEIPAGALAAGPREQLQIGLERGGRAQAISVETADGAAASATVTGRVVDPAVRARAALAPRDAIVGIVSTGLQGAGWDAAWDAVAGGGAALDAPAPGEAVTVGRWLRAFEKSYLSVLYQPLQDHKLRALVPIGGAAPETGLGVALDSLRRGRLRPALKPNAWPIPEMYQVLRRAAALTESQWFAAFGLGLGMLAVVPPEQLNGFLEWLGAWNEPCWVVGEMIAESRLFPVAPSAPRFQNRLHETLGNRRRHLTIGILAECLFSEFDRLAIRVDVAPARFAHRQMPIEFGGFGGRQHAAEISFEKFGEFAASHGAVLSVSGSW